MQKLEEREIFNKGTWMGEKFGNIVADNTEHNLALLGGEFQKALSNVVLKTVAECMTVLINDMSLQMQVCDKGIEMALFFADALPCKTYYLENLLDELIKSESSDNFSATLSDEEDAQKVLARFDKIAQMLRNTVRVAEEGFKHPQNFIELYFSEKQKCFVAESKKLKAHGNTRSEAVAALAKMIELEEAKPKTWAGVQI